MFIFYFRFASAAVYIQLKSIKMWTYLHDMHNRRILRWSSSCHRWHTGWCCISVSKQLTDYTKCVKQMPWKLISCQLNGQNECKLGVQSTVHNHSHSVKHAGVYNNLPWWRFGCEKSFSYSSQRNNNNAEMRRTMLWLTNVMRMEMKWHIAMGFECVYLDEIKS